MPGREPTFVFIVTHTTRYLDVVLAGLARQTMAPDHVIVSCDVDDESIGALARPWAARLSSALWWVRRRHHGVARCAQVRNNAVRCIIDDIGARTGRVIQIDGDVLTSPEFVERHVRYGAAPGPRRPGRLVYGHRLNVSREESAALDGDRVWRGEQWPRVEASEHQSLARRERRARRHLLMRRLGVGPAHKPKLLGCNWSAPLEAWLDLNGFDEHYQGWGYLDDEFARRAARRGWRCVSPIRDLEALHLWHATRQPEGPMSRIPTAQRFSRRDLPDVAEEGLTTPLEQHPVVSERLAAPAGGAVETPGRRVASEPA